MNIEEFLTLAAKEEASDLFIVAGLPLTMKVNGVMRRINEEKMMPQEWANPSLYKMGGDEGKRFFNWANTRAAHR